MITGWETLADSLSAAFGSDFVADFVSTLQDERRAREELVFSRAREIAAATARLEECWLDGLGECHMRVDPEVFFHWVRKEGRECWGDKNFVAEFKRDNPEVRVKTRPRKTMLVRP